VPPVPPATELPAISNTALGFGVATAGLDILSGVFGFLAGGEIAAIQQSRSRMIRLESEADAQRFIEQAEGFKARQKLAFLKAGVPLTGSPLDILDETVRVTSENLSAIRAGAAARVEGARIRATETRLRARAALLSGFARGGQVLSRTFLQRNAIQDLIVPRND